MESVLVTLFCCLLTGVMALVYSHEVRKDSPRSLEAPPGAGGLFSPLPFSPRARPGLRSPAGTWPRRTWHPERRSHWSSSASSSGCSPPSPGSSMSWCPCTCDKDPEPQGRGVCQELLVAPHLRGQVKFHNLCVGMGDKEALPGLRGSVDPSWRGEELPRSLQASAQPCEPRPGQEEPRAGRWLCLVLLDPALGRELCRIHGRDQALLQDAESQLWAVTRSCLWDSGAEGASCRIGVGGGAEVTSVWEALTARE